jgi:hypothetical protein
MWDGELEIGAAGKQLRDGHLPCLQSGWPTCHMCTVPPLLLHCCLAVHFGHMEYVTG